MLYTNIRNLIAKQALGNTIHTLHYTSLQKKKKKMHSYIHPKLIWGFQLCELSESIGENSLSIHRKTNAFLNI